MFQRFAAAETSIVRAIAPASRSGCHDARMAFEFPVAWIPPNSGLPYSFSLGGACYSRTWLRSTSSSSAISIAMEV